ncbi:Replication protein A 70 kDa DNA-binding subunit [Hordeum vulgare]|nr:Replication protein A 70 kDa DNA-binding subunit [Hordeum vulgare]
MLATTHNDLVNTGALRIGSVVHLHDITCNTIQNRRFIRNLASNLSTTSSSKTLTPEFGLALTFFNLSLTVAPEYVGRWQNRTACEDNETEPSHALAAASFLPKQGFLKYASARVDEDEDAFQTVLEFHDPLDRTHSSTNALLGDGC